MHIVYTRMSKFDNNGYKWKIRCHINCHSINVLYFLSYNSCNTTYTGKTVNFRHKMNNHITACSYETSIKKFDNHIFKCSNKNKHVAKESYFKDGHWWKQIVMFLSYIKWDLIQWTNYFYCRCCCCLYENDLYYRKFTLLTKSWNLFTVNTDYKDFKF